MIDCDNYFNNQSHLGKYKKHSYLGQWGGYQTKKQNVNCQHCKYFYSHNIEEVKILECTKQVWDCFHKIQTKFGLLRTLAIQWAVLLDTCCAKFVNLKCVHYMHRTTSIVDFVCKCSLTCFESRLQGSSLNIEACVKFCPFSFEPSNKLKIRSSKDECITGSNNHLRSTDLYRS